MPVEKTEAPAALKRYETDQGAVIYRIPLEVFPGFWGQAYVVVVEHADTAYRALIDTGSGFGASNEHLEAGLQQASAATGQDLSLENLTHVLITHAHIDHFGGLGHIRPRTKALIGVHELDQRVLTNYEERLTVVARRLREFLIEAGVSAERTETLIEMYNLPKRLFRSVQIDFTYEAVGMQVGPFEMLHVPGHCAGHVVIRLHDVLFSGDHVLTGTSPHQSPERLTLSTGLDHYLKSLESLRDWSSGVRLTLGGHKDPINDLTGRIAAIQEVHQQRLEQVLDLLQTPRTVAEISKELFGEVHGYNVLLAVEEAGAHVEYLYSRSLLGIKNLEELQAAQGGVPLLYYRL